MSKKLTIIIVDDNEIDLMIANRLFSRVDSSIPIYSFSSGEEMETWLNDSKNDLQSSKCVFLIDIYMPNSSGYTVSENVRSNFELPPKNVFCYLLSSSIDYSDSRKIKHNPNISGFIGKPITVDFITELIETYK